MGGWCFWVGGLFVGLVVWDVVGCFTGGVYLLFPGVVLVVWVLDFIVWWFIWFGCCLLVVSLCVVCRFGCFG